MRALYITDFAEDAPNAVVKKFKGKMLDEDKVNDFLFELIRNAVDDEMKIERIPFRIGCKLEGIGSLKMTPRNLYTFLLLQGIVFPYDFVERKQVVEFGGVYYSMQNGLPYMTRNGSRL